MDQTILQAARILIVDDEEANVELLKRILTQADYRALESTLDPTSVLALYRDFQPDLVLLDLHMPRLDGFAVMTQLKVELPQNSYFPILVLTADVTREAKERALSLGAKDFLVKPLDRTEVLLRINNLLETRFLHVQLQREKENLARMVQDRNQELWKVMMRVDQGEQELRLSQEETIQRLAIAGESRDEETAQHIERVSQYSALLARSLGDDAEGCEIIRIASQMHDVGKIGVPDSILLKPGHLTPNERALMEKHTEIGYRILGGSRSDLLKIAATIAWTHHERFDGTGYPRKLRGDAIPIEGRIVAVADVFDALTSERVYRDAYSIEQALEIMRQGRNVHFDPMVLDHFFASIDQILEFKKGQRDSLVERPDPYLLVDRDELYGIERQLTSG